MRDHPLNPYAIVFLLELELLQTFSIEMTYIFTIQQLFCFFNVFTALIDYINGFIYLAEELFSNSADTCTAINNSASYMLRMSFKI
jgi:hypothetical protein